MAEKTLKAANPLRFRLLIALVVGLAVAALIFALTSGTPSRTTGVATSPPSQQTPANSGPSGKSATPPPVSAAAAPEMAPRVTPKPVPGLPDAAASAADSRVDGFISKSAEVLTTLDADQKRTAAELEKIATGSAYDAVLASAAEFRENGWHQVGNPQVVRSTVVEYEAASTPKTMVVQACIDSSNVKVVTDDGTSLRSGPNHHALNTITLVQQEDRWLVESVGFPDNPRC